MSVIIFTLSCFLFGYTLVVAVRYGLRYRVARENGRYRAVLPLHVWLIATSYDIFVAGAAIQQLVYYRWWHSIVYIPALLIGGYAMWVLGHAQHRDDYEGVQEW